MKTALRLSALLMLGTASGTSFADGYVRLARQFEIENVPYGSGTPAEVITSGTEPAEHMGDGLYHVPNYLPGFPTAATIWPREVAVECDTDARTGRPACNGYRVSPALGRGEYVFVRPVARLRPPASEAKPPCQCPAPAPAPALIPVTTKKPLG